MKTGLVIAGGGSRGAFAAGAARALHARGIDFHSIAGTSTGALIAPLVAIGDYKELQRQYTTVRTRDIIRRNWRGGFWRGVYHTGPLAKRIDRSLREGAPSRHIRLMNRGCPRVFICTVSLQSGRTAYFSQKGDKLAVSWDNLDTLARAILGSCSQPIFMPPPEFDDQQWVDGGIREIAPVEVVIRDGAERVIVLLNSPDERHDATPDKYYSNIPQIAMRTLDLMLNELILSDVRCARLKYPDVQITVIRPPGPLPSDGLKFVSAEMWEMWGMGLLEGMLTPIS